MTIDPNIKNKIILPLSLYFLAVGISSYVAICIIIPAIKANRHPIKVSLINGLKNKYAKSDPNSSST